MTQTVTVTCWKDLELARIQARSMREWLEPAPHWCIINEHDPLQLKRSLDYWHSYIEPYFENRPVTVITLPEVVHYYGEGFRERYGYIRQQTLKTLPARLQSKPYVCLDSKNWFTKHTTVEQIPQQSRTWHYDVTRRDQWQSWSIHIQGLMQVPDSVRIPCIETPYWIDPASVQELVRSRFGTWQEFWHYQWSHDRPSEFMLLGLWDSGTDPGSWSYSRTMWDTYSDDAFLDLCEQFTVVAVHKSLDQDPLDLEQLLFGRA